MSDSEAGTDIHALNTAASSWSFVETGRQLELELAKLQRQLASQESNIATVELKLRDFVSKDDFERRQIALDSRLDRIEGALADLKQQCHVPNHTGTSIGEAVATNMSSIGELQQQVSKRALIDTVESLTSEIRQDIASQVANLDEVKASKAFVNSLKDTTRHLAEQLSTVEGMLSRKVDRSLLADIEATMANISEYEGFQRRVENKLTAHTATLGTHGTAIGELRSGAAEAVEERSATNAAVSQRALQSEVDSITQRLAAVQAVADAACPAASAHATGQALDDLRNAHNATQAELEDLTQRTTQQLQDIDSALRTKASVAAVDLKHDTATAEAALDALHSHIQRRATVDRVQGIEQLLEGNKAWQALLERKVEVALAFVEWFGEKGETYEYNAGSLERHMNALARGNRATVHGSSA